MTRAQHLQNMIDGATASGHSLFRDGKLVEEWKAELEAIEREERTKR